MYELKRLFKRHVQENLFKYLLVLSVFAMGILLGFIFSKNISSDFSVNLKQEIGVIMDGFSEGTFEKPDILKNSFFKNLRFTLIVFAGGLSVWLLPLSFAAVLSYGFSWGFTVGYLSLNFGAKGLGVALVSMIFVFLINIPVYVTLGVVSLNNSKSRKHSRNTDGNLGAYMVIFCFLFLVLMISVIADAFVVPCIIRLICS